MGHSDLQIDAHKLDPGKKHIIVAVHGYGDKCPAGIGSVCAQFSSTKGASRAKLEKLVFANATSRGEPLLAPSADLFSSCADSGREETVRYYFDKLLPQALPKIRKYSPTIEAEFASNRLDVASQCFGDPNDTLQEQLKNCRSLNQKLLQKQQDLKRDKQDTIRTHEALQKENERNKTGHEKFVQYLLKHKLFEAFANDESPERNYERALVDYKKQVVSQQRKHDPLAPDLFRAKLKLSQVEEVNVLLSRELAKATDFHDTSLREMHNTINSLQSDLRQTKHLTGVAESEVARLAKNADELQLKLSGAQAQNLGVQLGLMESCLPRAQGPEEPCEVNGMLREQITNVFNENFADHVQHGAHGRFVLRKYHVDTVEAAKKAAHELAYLYWAHDADTKRNGMTWQESKEAYASSLAPREIDLVLRKRFVIDSKEVVHFIQDRFKATSYDISPN